MFSVACLIKCYSTRLNAAQALAEPTLMDSAGEERLQRARQHYLHRLRTRSSNDLVQVLRLAHVCNVVHVDKVVGNWPGRIAGKFAEFIWPCCCSPDEPGLLAQRSSCLPCLPGHHGEPVCEGDDDLLGIGAAIDKLSLSTGQSHGSHCGALLPEETTDACSYGFVAGGEVAHPDHLAVLDHVKGRCTRCNSASAFLVCSHVLRTAVEEHSNLSAVAPIGIGVHRLHNAGTRVFHGLPALFSKAG